MEAAPPSPPLYSCGNGCHISLTGTPDGRRAGCSLPPIASMESATTLALERKVKAQEKRIAELSSQPGLLKRIDLERNKP